VVVETDKAQYSMGESVQATITNNLGDSIFLQGCTKVFWQLETNGQWQDRSGVICVWEGYAVEVKDNTSYDDPHAMTLSPAGTWRAAVTYGVGCQPGKPLSSAGCAGFDTVYSQPFTVAP
jgi:hypothetical protein